MPSLSLLHSITSSARASSVGGMVEAERLGGLEVDDQLDLGGLLDRQVGGLLALENAARIVAGPAVRVGIAAAVAHQAACSDELAILEDRRHRVSERQRAELFALAVEECVGDDHECAGPSLDQSCESVVDVALGACVEDIQLQPEGAGRRLQTP